MTDPVAVPVPAVTSEALALARIEVKLDNALDAQKAQGNTISEHAKTIVDHGNRITKLETLDVADGQQKDRSYSGRALVWTAVGAICAVAAVLIAVLLAVRGGQ